MSRLTFEKDRRYKGIYIARMGKREARVTGYVCNGRGIYGFDEPLPDPEIERALARRSDRAVARLMELAP